MNALVYIRSSWPTIRGNAAMFIGEVLKAGTNLNKGPRKDQEAPNVTVYIYPYIYNIQISLYLSLPPCLPEVCCTVRCGDYKKMLLCRWTALEKLFIFFSFKVLFLQV